MSYAFSKMDKSVYQINADWEKFDFDLLIQRGKVWDNEQKSLLIHSILMGVDIPKIYVYEEDGQWLVLDGKQRLTTIYDFYNEGFALESNTPNVSESAVADLKFSLLPEALQEKIKATMLEIIRYENLTEEQRDELFFRYNNGKALTAMEINKGLVGSKLLRDVEPIRTKKFIKNCVGKKGVEKNKDYYASWQFLMLDMNEYKGVEIGAKAVQAFSKGLKDDGLSEETVGHICEVLDYLDKALPVTETFMTKQVEIPMIFAAGNAAFKKGIAPEKFGGWAQQTFEVGKRRKSGDAYQGTKTGGTAKKENVQKRLNILFEELEQYINSDPVYVRPEDKPKSNRGRKKNPETTTKQDKKGKGAA